MHSFFHLLMHSLTLPGASVTPLSIPSGFFSNHQIYLIDPTFPAQHGLHPPAAVSLVGGLVHLHH